MTKEQINELLSDMMSMYTSEFGRAIIKKVALNLPMTAIECQVETAADDTYALMKTALLKCGTILEENMEDGIISGVIMSGAANMNPAFLLLWIDGSNIHLAAKAKEGLIKQHTAERAADAFKSALANLENS